MDREKATETGLPSTAFTPRAEETFYQVVDHPEFARQDAKLIYQALKNQMKPYSFGDHLKRYIYQKAEMKEPFETVPLDEYLNIIVESFGQRGVPASFQPTTGRVRAVARNWLSQQTVSRDSALLLGFGLRMSLAEVENLLTKGLLEHGLNLQNPREVLCGYCFEHDLGFYTYQNLERACAEESRRLNATGAFPLESDQFLEHTCAEENRRQNATGTFFREADQHSEYANAEARRKLDAHGLTGPKIHSIQELRNERELIQYTTGLFFPRTGESCQERQMEQEFLRLYQQAQAVAADILNTAEGDKAALLAKAAAEKLDRNDQFYDYQKRAWIQQAKARARKWRPEEITPGDIENILQVAIPKDRHGNLLPMKKSSTYIPFRGWRLSRQRLSQLLEEGTQVSRYDLLTLLFFIWSQKEIPNESRLALYHHFHGEADRMLTGCGLAPVYPANPYECFLLMCILSENPLGTYSDVIEQSYMEADA